VQRSRVKVLEDENKNLKQSIEYAQASIAKLLRITEACRSMFGTRSCYQRIKSSQGATNEVHRRLFKLECHSRRNNMKFFLLETLFLRLLYSWRRDRHFTWPSERREGLAVCRAKAVPSFLIYFKTLSIGPVPGIEPANSRSAVKRSTDRANTALEDESKIQFERVHHIVARTASPNETESGPRPINYC